MEVISPDEKLIINRIQGDFPIDTRPYKKIADELGFSEEKVLQLVRELKEKNFIRRIGGNFGPDKLGFFSTLCAAKVPESLIDKFAEIVNSYEGVTHNYVRENKFNIWFTFIAPERELIEEAIEEIKFKSGVKEIYNFPATRIFKISAKFKV